MRELLRAALKTGSGSAASLVLGVVAVKIMAVVLGPAGVGLFSLLRQTQQTVLTLATVQGQTAIVQGLASRQGQARSLYLTTAFWILCFTGLLISGGLLVFAPQIASWVVNQDDPATIVMIRWLSLAIALGVIYNYLAGVLNGFRAIGRLALVQTCNYAFMALFAYPAARLVVDGNLFAFTWLLIGSLFSSVALAFYFSYRSGWLTPLFNSLSCSFDRGAATHFFSIAGTMLITGFVATATQLGIRSLVVRGFGLSGAGVFDVAWTLSMTYVLLILTSFSTYYLPTLSQTNDRQARIQLIQRVFRLSMILMIPLVIIVIVLKPLVINVLYTGDFMPAIEIMRWMLIGDYFKVISWVFSFTMVAYADMKTYFWTEIIWGALSFGGAVLVTEGFHLLEGIGANFMLLYLAYLVYTFYYVSSRYHFALGRTMLLQWLAGLVLVVGASALNWSDTEVHWLTAGLWIAAGMTFSILVLSKRERVELGEYFKALRRVHSQ